MIGTLVNSAAIVVGSGIGVVAHGRLSEKVQTLVFQGLGLTTAILGISMALKTQNFMILILSTILGAVVGQLIDINRYFLQLTRVLTKGASQGGASQGFVTASLIFCMGSLAILGSIEDGLGHTPTLLYTKSVMDGIASVVLAASLGISVLFSACSVLLYQGTITLFASLISSHMTDAMVTEMSAAGGIMLLGLGLSLLKIKDIEVVNMLPALIFAIIFAKILI